MVVLNGHLDADALKRWIRLSETKHRGSSQLRTLLFMSSNIPGISFTASETASKVREITIASTLYGLLTPQFQQLNARLELANGGAPAGAAPRNSEEAKDLKDFANRDGLNTAAWAQFTSCASCGGARLDLFAYSLSTHRVVVAVSEDLNLSPSSYANPEYLKTVLAPITQQFKTELESAVTDGRLFASEFRLIIEGLDSYRQFKTIEQGLTRQDFISQPVVRRAAPRTAEFEFLSTLGMDELIQRFPQTEIGGFRLRPGRVDDSTLAARLGK